MEFISRFPSPSNGFIGPPLPYISNPASASAWACHEPNHGPQRLAGSMLVFGLQPVQFEDGMLSKWHEGRLAINPVLPSTVVLHLCMVCRTELAFVRNLPLHSTGNSFYYPLYQETWCAILPSKQSLPHYIAVTLLIFWMKHSEYPLFWFFNFAFLFNHGL